MKRTVIFLVVGPTAVAMTALAALIAAGASADFAQSLAAALAFLTFPIAALAGLADGYLARTFPISLRAPLTAIVGALAAGVPAFVLLHGFFLPLELMFFPLGGTVYAGACSLLSYDYGNRQEGIAPAQGEPRYG